MLNRNQTGLTLVLARGELLSLRLRARGLRITCLSGRLWATSSVRIEDIVFASGDSTVMTGRGKVVIEALQDATVRLEVLRAMAAQPASPRVSAASQPRMAFFL